MSQSSSSSAASSSSSSSAPSPLPTAWSVIARQGVVNARLEAQRKAALRPASNAHRHAIESILAFLSLSDLAKANHVCRHWHSAVHHMRPLGSSLRFYIALAECDRNSDMFRHVTAVQSDWMCQDPPSLTQLLHLFAAMPQLRSFAWDVPEQPELFAWPATLTKLSLRIPLASTLDDINLLLKLMPTSARGLKRLTVSTRLRTLRGLSFSFLLDLTELEYVYLDFARCKGSNPWRLGDSQVHALRQLTQLKTLDFPRLENASLIRLLRPPHQLTLGQFWPDLAPVDAQAAECLEALPTLVQLNVRLCSSATFLAQLPLLTTLHFDCRSADAQDWMLTADEVVQGLSPCEGLTKLSLTAPLQSSHLMALLPQLPRLITLGLFRMHCMDSLRCFSTGPVTSRLTSLTLQDCQHHELELNELGHLHQLKNLVSLSLWDSFTAPLTADDEDNYTPPSRYFKRMRGFSYHRTEDDDSDDAAGYDTDNGYSSYGSEDDDEGEDAEH